MSELELLEKEVSKSKRFKGFKARLKVENYNGLSIDIPIRYAKAEDEPMVKIVRRSPTGRLVQGKWIGEKKYFELDDDGKLTDVEVKEEEIKYYQVLEDGTEQEVEKMKRTEVVEVIDAIPMEMIDEYAVESTYEIWVEDQKTAHSLYELVQKLLRDRTALITTFTFGGFTAYTGILTPIVRDNGFCLAMHLASSLRKFEHLMPIPKGEAVVEKPKTVKIAPLKPKQKTLA
ncbi:MAG: hypothetical protein QXT26_07055 [Thermoproteota archaeon]